MVPKESCREKAPDYRIAKLSILGFEAVQCFGDGSVNHLPEIRKVP